MIYYNKNYNYIILYMGCFDIFCIICGNPCHKMFDYYTDIINEYNTTKKRKKYNNYIYEAYIKNPNLIKD